MDQGTIQILFALLRSAIRGTKLEAEEKNMYSPEQLPVLLEIAGEHDVGHLLALGLKENALISGENEEIESCLFKAVYRYERTRYEYESLCTALEKASISFLPLKGSVLRRYYREAWMRTSCDIDILVHREDLEKAVSYLKENLNYVEKGRATHDVSLFTQTGIHVELHFDLVEEGRAKNAIDVLQSVWENVTVHENSAYWYEMQDAFFYFYHVAHMAKHFENGGCGIRPFIDLWILDNMENADKTARDNLLSKGDLMQFANVSRELSAMWFDGNAPTSLSLEVQDFLLQGGVYGTAENRVALQQKREGGRVGYVLSRIFIPYAKLKRYYPVLEKHRYLVPVMQVRRWFMLLSPGIAKMARRELSQNKTIDKARARQMAELQEKIGL